MKLHENKQHIKAINTIIESCLLVILIGFVATMMVLIGKLQGTARVINYTGLVRGATQREVKLEITGNSDDELINYLDGILEDLKYEDGDYNLISLDDNDYKKKLDTQIAFWSQLKDEIYKVREYGYENTNIVILSEEYFHLADQTVSAAENYSERIAWNLGLPLLKVRFDSLLSSYFGESASNLRMVFDYCKNEPVVLLLDECDFIAKSRTTAQDVGEVPRIVNMLLTLLDEYDAPGLVIATTNLKVSLDEALFRRFDDVIEMALPGKIERKRLLEMTLSAIPTSPDIDLDSIAEQMDGFSAANVVLIAQRAAKISILSGNKKVCYEHFSKALKESLKF